MRDIEGVTLVMALPDAVRVVLADRLGVLVELRVVDGGCEFVAVSDAEIVFEAVLDLVADCEAVLLDEPVTLNDSERLNVDDGLADRLGVRLGVGRQAQQASIVTRQLSSLSAPLAKKLGVSTSAQAPAPEGAGWPAAGVPHSVALLA